jgi:hypothetical protein
VKILEQNQASTGTCSVSSSPMWIMKLGKQLGCLSLCITPYKLNIHKRHVTFKDSYQTLIRNAQSTSSHDSVIEISRYKHKALITFNIVFPSWEILWITSIEFHALNGPPKILRYWENVRNGLQQSPSRTSPKAWTRNGRIFFLIHQPGERRTFWT